MVNSTGSPLRSVFAGLTDRQRLTMTLLSEGRTSKEIAGILGISESAAIQRIETVRRKTGGLLRKDLARKYRSYQQLGRTNPTDCPANPPEGEGALPQAPEVAAAGQGPGDTCNILTGKTFQLGRNHADPHPGGRNHATDELTLADSIPFEIASPWAARSEPVVVPEVLEGRSAALNRLLAATGIALGMLAICLILLAVATEIGELV